MNIPFIRGDLQETADGAPERTIILSEDVRKTIQEGVNQFGNPEVVVLDIDAAGVVSANIKIAYPKP